MSITVLILTKDEERHIARALDSVTRFADRCVVVDSGSTDRTVELARGFGATVLSHPWLNHATQLNWGLDQLPADTDWVMRLDADEVVTPELAEEIFRKLPRLGTEIEGIYIGRRMTFLRRPMRWGGLFPVRVLRLFRYGRGRAENRWMDEHIMVSGPTAEFAGEIIDDNLNSLSWWTAKHNGYASREVVDMLNLEYGFMPHESVANLTGGQQAGIKRWVKETLYARLPGGLRAVVYFFYRYVVRLGFLDGYEGAAFHVLQGLWYRFLVDAKMLEVKRHMQRTGSDAVMAIHDVLGITVTPPENG